MLRLPRMLISAIHVIREWAAELNPGATVRARWAGERLQALCGTVHTPLVFEWETPETAERHSR